MSKFLKALRGAGDVVEIIVASSIVVEFIEIYRAKKKTASPILTEPADEPITAEVATTETAIAPVIASNVKNGAIYDLNGRRVQGAPVGQVYIQDGVKKFNK